MTDSPTDIYAISARVMNAARMAVGANLTPAGTMVCNTFSTTLKEFYDFAENLEDAMIRKDLKNLIKAQEEAPARPIVALCAGMKKKSSEDSQ